MIRAIRPTVAFARSPVARLAPVRFYSNQPAPIKEIRDLKQLNSLIQNKDKLTVIDFYATWCGPCKALEPAIEMLAKKVPEVQFGRVDVDQAQDVAREYGISAMPTFIYFTDGEKTDSVIGANLPKIVKLIQTHSGVDIHSR